MLTAAGCRSVSESETVSGEALDAPPEVTAKAWAIADGRTGEFLWGDHADDPRKTASTTKMMCTYVVLKMAEHNPAILDERVTFTELAGTTTGSTAAVKPGESASVRDLLYGLMLPSGNDAGNALAEHFHPRCALPDEVMRDYGLGNPLLKTRANFIAEMNRTARALGLSNTVYRSSFGDGGTEDDRTTTARDLTRVAWHAMQVPAFRAIVGTPRYEGKVWTTNGTPRVAVWENTNLLLGLGLGYDGVKTGTTTQAGSCLVASGQRNGDALIVVVLGSESDAGRYVDARNLFRWAWRQRGQR
jgi:D-alanyl-D-alanine carboxypeptidase (penicillin-binding protein 5/6)